MNIIDYVYDKCQDERLQVYYGSNPETDLIAEIYLAKVKNELVNYTYKGYYRRYKLKNGTKFVFRRRNDE